MKCAQVYRWLFSCVALFFGASLLCLAHAADSSDNSEPTFTVSQFKLEGKLLIPKQQIMELLSAYTNRPLTFATLREATVNIEKLYALKGYEVVRAIIPEQELVPGGSLTIQMINAKLDQVEVQGNKYISTDEIKKALVILHKGALVNTHEMDRNLRVLNDNPAITAKVTLEPSMKPAMVDAKVNVLDAKPTAGYVTFDNTGTPATGRYRLGFAVFDNDVFGKGHRLTAQYVTSPRHWSDVQVIGLIYQVPFYAQNSLFQVSYNDSNVNAGNYQLGGSSLNVQGAGTTLGLKWSYFLHRLQGMDQRLYFSVDRKMFVSQVRLNGNQNSLTPDLQSNPYTIGYSLLDEQPERTRKFDLSYSKNYPTGGQNSTTQYAKSNPRSKADFDLLKFSSSWSGNWFNWGTFTAGLDGQYSTYALISGEQFGAGGVYSVRGFEERAASGDTGLRESFEVLGPNWASKVGKPFKRLQMSAFVEAAQLRSNFVTGTVPAESRISSYGVGFRFAFSDRQQIRLDIAQVWKGTVVEPSGDVKLHFSFAQAL